MPKCLNNIFCIIGLGKHARLKLVPAIQNIEENLIVSVTRNSKNELKGIVLFIHGVAARSKLYLPLADEPDILNFLMELVCTHHLIHQQGHFE